MKSPRVFISSPLLIATLVLAIATALVSAQTVTTADITGLAVDPLGRVVTNAQVTLRGVDIGEVRTVVSGSTGLYRFTFVRPGHYQLSASSAGLQSDSVSLALAVGQVASVDLVMKVRAQKEVVTVTDVFPLLDSDNANFTYTLSSRQLQMLPLPGGDLVSLAYRAPAVVVNTTFGTGNFAASGIGSVSNLFTVNGADDMDPYYNVNNSGTTSLLLGANEIQQASVVQNAYEGEYGRQAGAQVNFVSKSGTNVYHGDLTYSYNGTVLNANDYFSNRYKLPRPHAVSNEYAAALGGRIIRNRLFFFLDTEGLRYALPGTPQVVGVPSRALQGYTLSAVQPSQVAMYQQAFSLYNAAAVGNRAAPVTNGTGPLQDGSGRRGCGALAGVPTGAGGTFGSNVSCADAYAINIPNQTSEWLVSGRLDYNISPRQSIFLRLKDDHSFAPFDVSLINPVFNVVSSQPDYEAQLNYTFAIAPALEMNFIGSGSYFNYTFEPSSLIAAKNAFPFRFNLNDGGPNQGGMAPLGTRAGFPQGHRVGQLQVEDNVSYIAGNHLLKAGLNYRYNNEADLGYSAFTVFGRFNFNSLDEFANGALNPISGSSYTQSFTSTPVLHVHLYNLGAYAQDQWAITPHLKLTGAMRLERTGNPSCPDRCFARLTTPFSQITKGLDVPYNASIQDGLSQPFYDVNSVVLQPRASFAYSPDRLKGIVIRGGVGIFSDLYPALYASLIAGNAPRVFQPSIRQGLVAIATPGSAPAIAAATAVAFQDGFARGATLPELQQAVAPATFSAPPYFSLPENLQTPRYVEWSFEVEHELGKKNVVGISYRGNHGYDTFIANPAANANVNTLFYSNGFGGLPTAPPDPRFSAVTQLTNAGYSNYNGMTVLARRTAALGFQGQISYTWSHSQDLASDGGVALFSWNSGFADQQNPYNLRSLNYSNSDYDVRHNVAADFIWDVPLKLQNRRLNAVFSSWSFAGSMNTHTGMPFGVYNSQIPGMVSSTLGLPIVLAEVVDPNVPTSCGSSSVQTPCFSSRAFATSATQTNFGNWPRNSFRGPGYFDFDSAIYKTIAIREGLGFRVGATAYNVFNHPNFADPGSDVARGGFGSIGFTARSPSGPYGLYGGPFGRSLVLSGRFDF